MASAADRGRHIVQLDLGGGWYGDAAGYGGIGELFEHVGRALICEIDAGDAARGERLRVGDVSGSRDVTICRAVPPSVGHAAASVASRPFGIFAGGASSLTA